MEQQITATRSELVKAFRRWQEVCPRGEDGRFTDRPATPEESADILIEELSKPGCPECGLAVAHAFGCPEARD